MLRHVSKELSCGPRIFKLTSSGKRLTLIRGVCLFVCQDPFSPERVNISSSKINIKYKVDGPLNCDKFKPLN